MTDKPQVKAEDLPKDLVALLQILRGLELTDKVVDEALHTGQSVEAVAESRKFLRLQHAGVMKNIKEHPEAHLILPEEEDNDE